MADFCNAVTYALKQLRMSDLTLREEQLQSMRAVYGGKDVFVCLPTGFGKSLCFQALPFLFDHRCGPSAAPSPRNCVIVFSPLVALMADQVESLRKRGVQAVVISSGTRDTIAKEFLASESALKCASIIFCAPEILSKTKWRDILQSEGVASRVCAIVVDEAHCISKW